MKTILHILSQVPDYTGSATFLKMLSQEGHKIGYNQYVIYGIPLIDNGKYDLKIPQKNHFPVFFECQSIEYPVPGMSDLEPYKSTKFSEMTSEMVAVYKKSFKDKILEVIEICKPDIIWTHHLWLVTSITKELSLDIPIFTFCHATCIRQLFLAPKFKSYVLSKCQNLDGVFVASSSQKQQVCEIFNIPSNKVHIIGGAINKEHFYPEKDKWLKKDNNKSITLTYAGKICNYKGVPYLLSLAKNLIEAGVNFELNIVGEGIGYEAEIIKRKAQSLYPFVNLVGFVNSIKLGQILRSTDIFIFPSFFEGIGLVLIEALACGCRIVVNNYDNLLDFIPTYSINSGIVQIVTLPQMQTIDTPNPLEIPKYIDSLTNAVHNQIQNINKGVAYDIEISNLISNEWSWKTIFDKVIKITTEYGENN